MGKTRMAEHWRYRVYQGVLVIGGSLVAAYGLRGFLVPNHIIDGGMTGISILLSYLTGLNIGWFLLALNLPFLLLGYNQIGKTFTVLTFLGVAGLAVWTWVLGSAAVVTQDLLLAAVFGGVIVGLGVGLVIRHGGSMDGTEIVAVVLSERWPFSVGEIIMFFNVFILGSAGFVFGWDRAMYSLIAYFVAYKTIDVVVDGLDESKGVWIVSNRAEELGVVILARLGRGVTYLEAKGGYSEEPKQMIYTVVTRLELPKLRTVVREIDPQAFVSVADIHETMGGYFRKRKIH
ncbi:YitT family protein [Kyrpidia sp.]|uniref:YitT family protein n=1 Tax=Kyrpidia sp. TaxID=2073077 RepID=UPI00258D9066|nr:YitT family protein [Kyrpidia sp.]MCL6577019.1 YitT family protein [Kyrpidia sp.]